jgi:putative PIN family toxin of toxin-antitoxin system
VPKPDLRVFLDTNVIFSGLYSPGGAPGIILKYFAAGRIGVVVSRQVLEEVVRTIKEKLPEALPALKRFLVNAPPEVWADPSIESIQHWSKEIHPADAAILAAAIAAKPDYFVTGDSHFLDNQAIRSRSGLNIVSPAQFLKLLESGSRSSLN